MKYPKYEKEIGELLSREGEIGVQDFVDIYGDMPMPSVYARIRGLVQEGKLSVVGKGRYIGVPKPAYRVEITPWMRSCADIMREELEGINSCITQRNGNLEVEVGKADMASTINVLRQHYNKVMYRKDVELLAEPPVGFVLVGRMVSEAPLLAEEDIEVSSPEKELVDAVCRKEDVAASFQRILEVYPVNQDKLLRYASRRGVSQEVKDCLKQVNQQRVQMFASIQRYLAHTQIIRAWVFGSFARREETDASDLDLLVDYDKTNIPSLITLIGYQLDMEEMIGREVDLIVNGALRPFAKPSAERDKYMIYER